MVASEPLDPGLVQPTGRIPPVVLVMTSDNNLSTLEMNYLFQAGQKLGFGKEFTRVLIRWASEGIVWRRKMKHLVQVGSELEAEYEA